MELRIDHVSYQYGKTRALNDISIRMEDGIYGLLGPNGAGKSTLMNLLTLNLKLEHGSICLDGVDIMDQRSRYTEQLGYMPQADTVYPYFTGLQFMYYIASIKRMNRHQACKQSEELLRRLDLWQVRNRKVKAYSGGMKRRLMLAQALLNNPDVLILDEPTAGMDPHQRVVVRNLIGELSLSHIVLISTHVVSDIEYIANRILVMDKGELLADETPYALCDRLRGKVCTMQIAESCLKKYAQEGIINGISREKDGVRIRLISDQADQLDADMVPPSLDDVYQYMFGAMHDV